METLLQLRRKQPKLDMREGMIKEFLSPPVSPQNCIFAKTTLTLSADLKTRVKPCQFGGEPDCMRCGCIASMGLAAVGRHKLVGPLTAGHIFWASASIGRSVQGAERMLRRVVRRNGPLKGRTGVRFRGPPECT